MPKPTPEKSGPRLDQLHGMPAARAWGEALAADLADYKAGRITWADLDRGALLHGEPGTGKTIFAKALANTCDLELIHTSYADWQRAGDGHLGDVLAAMHECFKLARRRAPCVVFIDEFDAIPTRTGKGHNQRWWTSVIAALNEALDGIAAREGVIVIAAANYPDRIDPALLRAGRLDTKIEITPPTTKDLEGIIRFHLGDLLPDADLRATAIATAGSTGADIEKFVRTARRYARKLRRPLLCEDLFAVLEENTVHISPALLRRMAIHEAGHAVAAIELKVSRNVCVTLLHRGERTAVTYFDPEIEALTLEVVERRIAVALAGRAAEQVILGDVAAGAGGSETSDLALASRLAFQTVAAWGLSRPESLQWHGDIPPEQLLAIRPDLADDVRGLLHRAYTKALTLLQSRRDHLELIADHLMRRRVLAHDDLVALLETRIEKPAARARKSRA